LKKIVQVPDLGDANEVEVIEVCVKKGDLISAEDPLIVLESEKAAMEVPSPDAGKIIDHGKHEELMNSSKLYKNFYEKQIQK